MELLSTLLWRQRELLELLLFKLEEEQLLLAAGRSRWLSRATREVEMVLEEIRRVELARAVEVEAVAARYGLGGDASLSALAAAVESPWNDILTDHRVAFLELTAEIGAIAQANRALLTAGYSSVRSALDGIAGPSPTAYTASGAPTERGTGGQLVNGAL